MICPKCGHYDKNGNDREIVRLRSERDECSLACDELRANLEGWKDNVCQLENQHAEITRLSLERRDERDRLRAELAEVLELSKKEQELCEAELAEWQNRFQMEEHALATVQKQHMTRVDMLVKAQHELAEARGELEHIARTTAGHNGPPGSLLALIGAIGRQARAFLEATAAEHRTAPPPGPRAEEWCCEGARLDARYPNPGRVLVHALDCRTRAPEPAPGCTCEPYDDGASPQESVGPIAHAPDCPARTQEK